jgi:hypothetical protein
MGLAIVVGVEVMDVHHRLSVLVRGRGEANADAEDRAERNGDGAAGNAGSRRYFICLHSRCLPLNCWPIIRAIEAARISALRARQRLPIVDHVTVNRTRP